MNRILKRNIRLKQSGKKAFVAYITAGFPNIKVTEQLVSTLEKSGVDFIELGMPFSDPIADGPTIQYASAWALKKGMNLVKYLKLIRRLRKKTQLPLIMMTYYNPIFKFGLKRFAQAAANSGIDGVIVPDLPPEEAVDLKRNLQAKKISLIFLLAPTSDIKRIKKIVRLSSGFIYYVSLTGVTGTRGKLPSDLIKKVRLIKQHSRIPIYVGFGISSPKQVKYISQFADGVIIGSAIIKIIQTKYGKKGFLRNIERFIVNLNRTTY